MIYMQAGEKDENFYSFRLKRNFLHNTVFIVDEASMMSDDPDTGERGLLNDLIRFVFERKSNKLMMIGDAAQLPPVGKELSPALDADYLVGKFSVNLIGFEMKDVVRQEKESGILVNATQLREKIFSGKFSLELSTKGYTDIFRMGGERLEDGLRYAYDKYGTENTVVICRSNKSATMYNQYIRRTIRFSESEIEAGDIVMIVRNNYSVLSEDSKTGFLANGDFAEVTKVVDFKDMYGFRFATLELRLLDVPEQEIFEAKVFLDTLHSFESQLSFADYRKLQTEVMKDHEDIESKKELYEKLAKDPYLNALQIKFAYSLTCHKSQGGQWSAVFVDQGFLKEDMVNKEFLRWMYTAMTRATKELFLVNFAPQFFKQ
jgi:exodeoxyribonuclease-5